MTRARTVAVCCACHKRRPWRGSGVHGRGGVGRAAAVHSRRVGELGPCGPRWVVDQPRCGRTNSLTRTASKGGGTQGLNMRVGDL
eukprot:3136271-Pleurochrysis_carterae.AAC.4